MRILAGIFALLTALFVIPAMSRAADVCQADLKLKYVGMYVNKEGVVCRTYYDSLASEVFHAGDQIMDLNGVNIAALSPADKMKALQAWERTLVGGTVGIRRSFGRGLMTMVLDERMVARHWWRTFLDLADRLEERLAKIALRLIATSSPRYEGLGIEFATGILNPDREQRLPGFVSGVVTRKGYPSPAGDAGIKKGDRIAGVNDVEIPRTMNRFEAAHVINREVKKSDGAVRLLIERKGQKFEAEVKKTLIFEGKADRFFRNRGTIRDIDARVQALDKFKTDVISPWALGQTRDAWGNALPQAKDMKDAISAYLNLYESTKLMVDDLDEKLPWWTETECLFRNDSRCEN